MRCKDLIDSQLSPARVLLGCRLLPHLHGFDHGSFGVMDVTIALRALIQIGYLTLTITARTSRTDRL